MAVYPGDIVETVLDTARVRLSDAIVSIGGEILTDTAAFTQTVVNSSWRRLQEYLADKGFQALNRETVLGSVPAWGTADLGTFVWFNWIEYFNGNAASAAPVLPQDMIAPLGLYERVSGSNSQYFEMDQALNGLPTVTRGPLNRMWEWRQETIYMPGATGPTDIRMRYAGYFADFETTGTGPAQVLWQNQPVPIMRALSAFSWYICRDVAAPRGDLDAGQFEQLAQQAAEQIWNRDPRQPKSIDAPSQYDRMVTLMTPLSGPAGPRGPQKVQ